MKLLLLMLILIMASISFVSSLSPPAPQPCPSTIEDDTKQFISEKYPSFSDKILPCYQSTQWDEYPIGSYIVTIYGNLKSDSNKQYFYQFILIFNESLISNEPTFKSTSEVSKFINLVEKHPIYKDKIANSENPNTKRFLVDDRLTYSYVLDAEYPHLNLIIKGNEVWIFNKWANSNEWKKDEAIGILYLNESNLEKKDNSENKNSLFKYLKNLFRKIFSS